MSGLSAGRTSPRRSSRAGCARRARPVRAQRVEEARPDRTCVADEIPSADDLPKSGSLKASSTARLYQATWNGCARSRPAGIHRVRRSSTTLCQDDRTIRIMAPFGASGTLIMRARAPPRLRGSLDAEHLERRGAGNAGLDDGDAR